MGVENADRIVAVALLDRLDKVVARCALLRRGRRSHQRTRRKKHKSQKFHDLKPRTGG